MQRTRKASWIALGLTSLGLALGTNGCVTLMVDGTGAFKGGGEALMPATLAIDLVLSPIEALWLAVLLAET